MLNSSRRANLVPVRPPALLPSSSDGPDNTAQDPPDILHVTTKNEWRGGEQQLLCLMRSLRNRGLQQVLAAPAGSAVVHRAFQEGHRVVTLNGWVHGRLFSAIRLAQVRFGTGRSVFHAHSSAALDLAIAARRLRRSAAVVYTRRTALRARRSQKYRTAADLYVAVSAAVERELIEAGATADRLTCIPDAVDTENLRVDDALARAKFVGQPGPIVVSIGFLAPEKGHQVLLRAWPRVLRQVPDARLFIAGDGPEWVALLELMQELHIRSSSRMLGFHEPIGELLQAADLLVMPSLTEGLGSAAVEAAWMGLPVVASAVGGLSEAVVHGRTGLLVPPDIPETLAEAIIALLTDPALRTRMGEAARIRARSCFSSSAIANEYLQVYRRALHSEPLSIGRQPA